MSKDGFSDDFRRNVLTGLAALFPILITLFLFVWLYKQMDNTVGRWAKNVAVSYLASEDRFDKAFPNAPAEAGSSQSARRRYVDERVPAYLGVFLGLCIIIVGVYLTGKFLRGYIGRRLISWLDAFFERFPVVKTVYPHAREVGNFLFGVSEERKFDKVVAVEYPRRGVYTVGFATGHGIKDVAERARSDLVTVFIPTSPTPFTGFIIMVPAHEVTAVDMSVDEAFRYCITAGMLTPRRQAVNEQQLAELIILEEKVRPVIEAGSVAQDSPDAEGLAPAGDGKGKLQD